MAQCSPVVNQQPLSFDAIEAQVKFLEGEILTIADASFSDREQRKAAKDLIKHHFSRRLRHFNDLCYADGSEKCYPPTD